MVGCRYKERLLSSSSTWCSQRGRGTGKGPHWFPGKARDHKLTCVPRLGLCKNSVSQTTAQGCAMASAPSWESSDRHASGLARFESANTLSKECHRSSRGAVLRSIFVLRGIDSCKVPVQPEKSPTRIRSETRRHTAILCMPIFSSAFLQICYWLFLQSGGSPL
jgi:hypothetical protein